MEKVDKLYMVIEHDHSTDDTYELYYTKEKAISAAESIVSDILEDIKDTFTEDEYDEYLEQLRNDAPNSLDNETHYFRATGTEGDYVIVIEIDPPKD